ncbi:hypothetical protein BO94DRAFT_549354 [Aspergillus sclerotioniger CBS 115572]|uniref:2EXR domain-containing protein n=1 Tax=Aspergillus sclerotioniger CBS 115572 TaxID=1450535 RepID=A0A317VSY2_9EURO|nr:hypothetical protein BO94DRAFT_549354 [Aspergillus sclerotioniger CBS 115572]PWY76042.1 hypothetical protein BO94DRAFT_549354 [Aspergillus sclerotioniger CBS 115572]
MDTAAIGFPLFPCLPTELRLQIWEEALPKLRRPLYMYRLGCWGRGSVSETHIHYEFKHRRLRDLVFSTSLFFVNCETRYVVLRWMRKHGIQMMYDPETSSFRFRRSFNPQSDIILIPATEWACFIVDPWMLVQAERLGPRAVTVGVPGYTHIAIPMEICESKRFFLGDLFRRVYWSTIEKIFVVTNAQDMLEGDVIKAGQHWELDSFTGFPIFVWNSERRLFEPHHNVLYEGTWDYVLERLQEASGGMMNLSGWEEGHRLEVHSVSVIRM